MGLLVGDEDEPCVSLSFVSHLGAFFGGVTKGEEAEQAEGITRVYVTSRGVILCGAGGNSTHSELVFAYMCGTNIREAPF